MTYNTIIAIVLIVVTLIAYLISWLKGKEENSVSTTLFSTGVLLIASGIPAISDAAVDAIFQLLSLQTPENEGGYCFRAIIGLVLIVLGIILKYKLKEHIYILNMYGIAAQKDIDEPNALKDLKFAEHKTKEQIVDFVQFFDGGAHMKTKMNESICKHVENNAIKFNSKVANSKKVFFTGMAPIPYTVYAGTYLGGTNISSYLEYNSQNGGHYYKLTKATKKEKKAGWEHINSTFPTNIDFNSTEVVLAISISHTIRISDLSQFSADVVKLSLNNPKDNVVKYSQQLDEYTNSIYEHIETKIKEKYPNLKTIHIVASIPSCISLALGKQLGLRTNRLGEVVVHHYLSSNNLCYPFGVYVNGNNKGKLLIN